MCISDRRRTDGVFVSTCFDLFAVFLDVCFVVFLAVAMMSSIVFRRKPLRRLFDEAHVKNEIRKRTLI